MARDVLPDPGGGGGGGGTKDGPEGGGGGTVSVERPEDGAGGPDAGIGLWSSRSVGSTPWPAATGGGVTLGDDG